MVSAEDPIFLAVALLELLYPAKTLSQVCFIYLEQTPENRVFNHDSIPCSWLFMPHPEIVKIMWKLTYHRKANLVFFQQTDKVKQRNRDMAHFAA